MSLETPNAFADEENILLHTALFKQVLIDKSAFPTSGSAR